MKFLEDKTYNFSFCVLWRPLERRQIWELHSLLLSLLDITKGQTFDEVQCHSSPHFWCVFFGWNQCLIFDQFDGCLEPSTQKPTPCNATLISHGSWTAFWKVCQVCTSRSEMVDSSHSAKYLPKSYAEKSCLDFTQPSTYNQTRDFKSTLNDGSMVFLVITSGWIQGKAISTVQRHGNSWGTCHRSEGSRLQGELPERCVFFAK